jgi:ribosomal-protein-alanine N-acetyltransferase
MEEMTTHRLRLRPLTLNDLDSLEAIWTDPAVSEHLLTRPTRRAEVAAQLYAMIEYAKLWGMWAVELKPARTFIGRCGFYPFSGEGDLGAVAPELAFLLARSHWGRGLATEAAGATLLALFRSCDCSRVVALVHPKNGASHLARMNVDREER